MIDTYQIKLESYHWLALCVLFLFLLNYIFHLLTSNIDEELLLHLSGRLERQATLIER